MSCITLGPSLRFSDKWVTLCRPAYCGLQPQPWLHSYWLRAGSRSTYSPVPFSLVHHQLVTGTATYYISYCRPQGTSTLNSYWLFQVSRSESINTVHHHVYKTQPLTQTVLGSFHSGGCQSSRLIGVQGKCSSCCAVVLNTFDGSFALLESD